MFQNVVKYTYKTSLMTCSCLCAASFAAQAEQMQCLNVDCESLGYTNVEDLAGKNCKSFLTCPYDPRYIKCDLLPTCENLGFTNDDKSDWCTNIVRCPTDPSYTLCRALCGPCPVEGTAFDPAELGCVDGYTPALTKRRVGHSYSIETVVNDCGYTCYKCVETTDTGYYCKDPEDESYIYCVEHGGDEDSCDASCSVATQTECPAGTYIVEVRHPTTVHNSNLPDRYICAPCPDGLSNVGINNYDCKVNGAVGCNNSQGYYVACQEGWDGCVEVPTQFGTCYAQKCDHSQGLYGTCQEGWDKCVEVSTQFGTCYVNQIQCGQGVLSNYIYSSEQHNAAQGLVGHTWESVTDSNGTVCWKTSCPTTTAYDKDMSFQTEEICESNYNNYAVSCKEDGFSCYIFDKCDTGYVEHSLDGYFSCICDTETYPYEVGGNNLPMNAKPDVNGGKCRDTFGWHYEDFACIDSDKYQIDENGCTCSSEYKYNLSNVPNFSSPDGLSCTDTTGTWYTTFICDEDHRPSGNKCLCPVGYTQHVPYYAHYFGSPCVDSDGYTWYEDWECDYGYDTRCANGSCSCVPMTCEELGLFDDSYLGTSDWECEYKSDSKAGEECYECKTTCAYYSLTNQPSLTMDCPYERTAGNGDKCYSCHNAPDVNLILDYYNVYNKATNQYIYQGCVRKYHMTIASGSYIVLDEDFQPRCDCYGSSQRFDPSAGDTRILSLDYGTRYDITVSFAKNDVSDGTCNNWGNTTLGGIGYWTFNVYFGNLSFGSAQYKNGVYTNYGTLELRPGSGGKIIYFGTVTEGEFDPTEEGAGIYIGMYVDDGR